MICFLVSRGYNTTMGNVQKAGKAGVIRFMNYDQLIRARWLRRATYIFTDLDRLGYWDIEQVSHMYLNMKSAGLQVWNNPARVKCRYPLLRALHAAGLNDFRALRVDELNSSLRFPVFVRKVNGHREPLSGLLETRAEVDQVVADAVAAGTPLEHLLVVEFAAEPVRPGLYRKLAGFRVGNAIVPHVSVHDKNWLVKYGTMGIAGEELYQEEKSMLQNNPFADHLKKVFDLAGIEYGRADFGYYRGRLQIYEINTNPTLGAPQAHPSPIREESMRIGWDKYLQALKALDSESGWPVWLPNGKLQKHRARRNLLVRSRSVHW